MIIFLFIEIFKRLFLIDYGNRVVVEYLLNPAENFASMQSDPIKALFQDRLKLFYLINWVEF